MNVDIKYSLGKKILFIKNADAPSVIMYEAGQGKWAKNKVDWKVGYSSDYSLIFSEAVGVYKLPNSSNAGNSRGNSFLSHEHVLMINTNHTKTDFYDLDGEPKQIAEDLDEIMEAMMEDINDELEKQLNSIVEFSVSQETDGGPPIEAKCSQSAAIKTAKGELPSANDEIYNRLHQQISEAIIDTDISTITGFYFVIKCQNEWKAHCLNYDLGVWVKYMQSQTDLDKARDDKPKVVLKGALIQYDRVRNGWNLEGKFFGHPSIREGQMGETSTIVGFEYDEKRNASIETHNTMFMVGHAEWRMGAPDSDMIAKVLADATKPTPQNVPDCVAEGINISFTNIPCPYAPNKWFWQKLKTSLTASSGEPSSYQLMDASEQDKEKLKEGWLIGLDEIELLGEEFSGFVNYLKDEYF